MKGARGPSRPPGRRPSRAPSAEPRERKPRSLTLGTLAVWALLLVPPFLVVPIAKESFRLPKLMASEWLALLSLLFLAWRLQRVERVRWADLWRLPAVRAVLPLLLVATLGSLASDHPHHVREALADLWIGAACLVGWSVGLPSGRMERLLKGLLGPASALSLIAILQFHDILQPLRIYGVDYDPRLALTSTAGNPGDLGAYLVLPCLIAQWILARGRGASGVRARWAVVAALGVCLYALLLTRTLAAVAALGLASLILWGLRLPRRRAVLLLAGGAAAAAVLVLAVAPLRERVFEKVSQAREGQLNAVLTGRLDGWNAALWMLRENPWTGVGHGAFRPEYVPAKLALLDRGVEFYPQQVLVVFANAHNELLEVAADSGWPGLLALGWGVWVVGITLRRRRGDAGDGAFARAGAIALAVLSLAHFPFRIALVAFPAILFLAWSLRPPEPLSEEGAGVKGRALAWPLVVLLGIALLAQTDRWRDRMVASRLLRQVEILSAQALAAGRAPRGLMAANLEALRRAAVMDPVEIGIPIARGSQFLLLGSPRSAIESYREAEALEPRPEIYMNLGQALLMTGEVEEARRQFALGVRLDPRLAAEVPAAAR